MVRNAIIRFDVSHEVGIGHMKRAINIASHLDDYLLIVQIGGKKHLQSEGIEDKKILEIQSNSVWWIEKKEITWPIIFDICYANNRISAEWQIAKACSGMRKVVVIDSMPPDEYKGDGLKFERSPELVVTPYYRASEFREKPNAKKWIYGAEYCILEGAYRGHINKRGGSKKEQRILISCGGSDPTRLTERCLRVLAGYPGGLDVVVGPLFDEELANNLKKMAIKNDNVAIHMRPKTLARANY